MQTAERSSQMAPTSPGVVETQEYVGCAAVCMPAPIKQIAPLGQPAEKVPCAQT